MTSFATLGLTSGFALNRANEQLFQATNRMATGLRINRGADDPAGLISSERLDAMLAQLDAETRTIERQRAVTRTADGALSTVSDQLNRADALAVAAANTGGVSDAEREAMQMELDSIVESVGRTVGRAEFNGDRLFDGTTTLRQGDAELAVPELTGSSLGETEIDGETFSLSSASTTLNLSSGRLDDLRTVVDTARSQVLGARGSIGAFERNVLEPAERSTRVQFEQTSAALSVLRDADFAAEASNATRAGILGFAATGALRAEQQAAGSIISLLA